MARANGRPVAGVFSFVFRNTLFPHYSGAAPDANALAANNFIYWELMKSAINQGIRRFDFGRSKQNTGAYQFKSAWNMQVDPLAVSDMHDQAEKSSQLLSRESQVCAGRQPVEPHAVESDHVVGAPRCALVSVMIVGLTLACHADPLPDAPPSIPT